MAMEGWAQAQTGQKEGPTGWNNCRQHIFCALAPAELYNGALGGLQVGAAPLPPPPIDLIWAPFGATT